MNYLFGILILNLAVIINENADVFGNDAFYNDCFLFEWGYRADEYSAQGK